MMRQKSKRMPVLVAAGMLGATGAMADVTIEQNFRVDAFGAMSSLKSEGVLTKAISGRKLRADNQVTAEEGMARFIARNPNGATLVILEDEQIVTLMPAEQKYSLLTMEDMRARFDYGTQARTDAAYNKRVLELPVEEVDCRWTLPERQSVKTGKQQEFAGILAEQHLIGVSQDCRVPQTKQTCELFWSLELWTASDIPGQEEALAFRNDLLAELGGEDILSAAQLSAGRLLALFKAGWNQVLAMSDLIEGYPVRTVMGLEIGGQTCTDAAGTPISRTTDRTVIEDIARDTARSSAENTATNAAAQTASGAVGGGLGGAVAGTAIGEVGRRIFDKMRRKGVEEKEEKIAEAEAKRTGNPEDDSVMLFVISTELTSVSLDPVDAEQFRIPNGWTEVEYQ